MRWSIWCADSKIFFFCLFFELPAYYNVDNFEQVLFRASFLLLLWKMLHGFTLRTKHYFPPTNYTEVDRKTENVR